MHSYSIDRGIRVNVILESYSIVTEDRYVDDG